MESEGQRPFFDGLEKIIALAKSVYQPAIFAYVFVTGRQGHISNPSSSFLPSPPSPGGGGPPPPLPGMTSVTFRPMRRGVPYTGTGYVTVNGDNHVTTLVGLFTNPYTIGSSLVVNFTGLGLSCTPTAPQTVTVNSGPTQDVAIDIPC